MNGMQCPECGAADLPDQSSSCPECGYPILILSGFSIRERLRDAGPEQSDKKAPAGRKKGTEIKSKLSRAKGVLRKNAKRKSTLQEILPAQLSNLSETQPEEVDQTNTVETHQPEKNVLEGVPEVPAPPDSSYAAVNLSEQLSTPIPGPPGPTEIPSGKKSSFNFLNLTEVPAEEPEASEELEETQQAEAHLTEEPVEQEIAPLPVEKTVATSEVLAGTDLEPEMIQPPAAVEEIPHQPESSFIALNLSEIPVAPEPRLEKTPEDIEVPEPVAEVQTETVRLTAEPELEPLESSAIPEPVEQEIAPPPVEETVVTSEIPAEADVQPEMIQPPPAVEEIPLQPESSFIALNLSESAVAPEPRLEEMQENIEAREQVAEVQTETANATAGAQPEQLEPSPIPEPPKEIRAPRVAVPLSLSSEVSAENSSQCYECGMEVEPSANFCPYCRASLIRRLCPGCRRLVAGNTAFCAYCGAPATSIAEPPRNFATVLAVLIILFTGVLVFLAKDLIFEDPTVDKSIAKGKEVKSQPAPVPKSPEVAPPESRTLPSQPKDQEKQPAVERTHPDGLVESTIGPDGSIQEEEVQPRPSQLPANETPKVEKKSDQVVETKESSTKKAAGLNSVQIQGVPTYKHRDVGLARYLNSVGFRLIRQRRYQEAVPILKRSVSYFPENTRDIVYAYALFNLGHALRMSGRANEAIPVLEARLKINNQRETVRRELAAARVAALGTRFQQN